MKNEIKCPHCNKVEVIKWGLRKTQNRGKIQRYCCKNCNKKFIESDGFYRMRNPSQKITMCLDLFYKGISTRKIQEHLQAFYPHNSSNVTIYKWVVKYAKMISSFTDTLKPNISPSIQMDELEYKTKGKQSWFIDVIDVRTRYMVASNFAYSRNPFELKQVMKKAKDNSNNEIFIISTDALQGYSKCIRTLWRHGNKRPKHFRIKSSSSKFNWKIERLHNSIRSLTQNFRGFHGSLESANSIMKGYQVYYNFIRTHQTLGKTPSELALPEMKLGINRWLDLIKLSTEGGKNI